ncbi:MAG TPA: SRPBCC family protein [Actinophytocola sp.]|uniref:SRPBCC family protein n=1 Tax=Actinophytocola sp. TaxID=1872138 RepID=UPI002DB7F0D6|nr:SRPBCC family protein [Actinophytocola sp.]HEU5471274.1 SRPBCC family protein [Actinophytocola sp.]
MPEIRLESDIRGTAEAVFTALVDLRGYSRWLAPSTAFPGTTEISPGPVGVGTTYVESSSQGVRRGTVTEYQPPDAVAFHQPMTMKPGLLGVIDIRVRYTLTQAADSVQLSRVVTLTLPTLLKLARPVVLREFRKESERTMRALKAFVETQAAG